MRTHYPMSEDQKYDHRISLYIEAAERLRQGEYDVHLPEAAPGDDLGRLGLALKDLAHTLERRYQEIQKLDQITRRINAGLLLDEILENVYQDFREIIPYNRIGFSLLEDNNRVVRARWAKTDQPLIRLGGGYEAVMAGSSLQKIMDTGRPRIINDLDDYLRRKPSSESTRLIVEEGIRSSLTCPLIANGVPVGFMFFSSIHPNTYTLTHIQSFMRIAGQLSVIVEKGRLVSELAQQKSDIEDKNAELIHLNELKNRFLGIAAHDLRNPIAYIQMSSEFLTSAGDTIEEPVREQILTDIKTQSQHMLDLLNELLDVTKIESGRLDLQPGEIIVSAFLDGAVYRQSQLASPKGTRILLGTVPPGVLIADEGRLRQVIDNLLSNAVKYSPAGSTVYVSADHTASEWRIAVRDEGPGIKPGERDLLFQDFARLSNRPTGGESSTGLGLAISRRIVEAHGGQIGVDSEPGHGATFWFTLPA